MSVTDLTLHRSNAAAHEGMRALLEFRSAETALRFARRGLGGEVPQRFQDRYSAANAALQNAIREYERARLPREADGGG